MSTGGFWPHWNPWEFYHWVLWRQEFTPRQKECSPSPPPFFFPFACGVKLYLQQEGPFGAKQSQAPWRTDAMTRQAESQGTRWKAQESPSQSEILRWWKLACLVRSRLQNKNESYIEYWSSFLTEPPQMLGQKSVPLIRQNKHHKQLALSAVLLQCNKDAVTFVLVQGSGQPDEFREMMGDSSCVRTLLKWCQVVGSFFWFAFSLAKLDETKPGHKKNDTFFTWEWTECNTWLF